MSQLNKLLNQQPSQSKIRVEQQGRELQMKAPPYDWSTSDPLINVLSIAGILAFSGVAYAIFFHFDVNRAELWVQILVKASGLLIVAGLLYWIFSEINAINEQQTITLQNDSIQVDKKRLFRSSHTTVPLSTLHEINIESYPIIYFGGDESVLFLEFSEEEEKIWAVKVMKVWVYQQTQQKV
jgi:hypothetical protein